MSGTKDILGDSGNVVAMKGIQISSRLRPTNSFCKWGRLTWSKATSGIVVFALLANACSKWSRVEILPVPLAERQQIELWTGRANERVHGVLIHDDSLFGIPTWQAPSCVECGRWYMISRMDSIRVRKPSSSKTATVIGGVGVGILLLNILCHDGGCVVGKT